MTPRLPFKPIEAGYAFQPGDGTQSVQLEGGSGRYRSVVQDNSSRVNCSWALVGDEYSRFMGFWRNAGRGGGWPFEVSLVLDCAEARWYRAMFVPQSLNAVPQGGVWIVSAQLEVEPLPEFSDPSLDYWGSLILMLSLYGDVPAVREVLNLFAELANEDLPNAKQR